MTYFCSLWIAWEEVRCLVLSGFMKTLGLRQLEYRSLCSRSAGLHLGASPWPVLRWEQSVLMAGLVACFMEIFIYLFLTVCV